VAQAKSYFSGEAITGYIRALSVEEPEVLRRLRDETAAYPNPQMQISPEQGQFFRVLLAVIGARKTLEIGVFTGYSSIVAALALPPDGRVIACDSSEEFTRVARRYWKEAGVENKIELLLGPAAESLRALLNQGAAGTFDFVFIDADKAGYDLYYELSLELVRRRGLIVLDNMLRRGDVLDSNVRDEDVTAIRALNEKLHSDSRVVSVLTPLADGITLAVKL
jgi:predicted O-methyltransferase YrrM